MAYRADIEIAVRGAQELKRLQNEVSATSKLVDQLNNYVQNIGDGGIVRSINNLRSVVADAGAAFSKAALGTEEATIAATKYVRATSALNDGLRERAALLKDIAEQERRARLAASGIRETTQYAGPIGPGPASPVGALVGQKSPVEERIRRTIRARQEEKDLQEALLRLEQKSAALANDELQARGAIAAATAKSVNAAKFAAGQTTGALMLPAFQERGLQILNNNVKLNESNLRMEQALNGERARGVRFLEKQSAEEQRQVNLGILGKRTNRLPGQGAGSAGAFPVSGPIPLSQYGAVGRGAAASALGQTVKGRASGAIGNALIGGAFPLLFGQGAGAATGGAIGGLVGGAFGGIGGFAGSLVGTLLGDIASRGQAVKQLGEDLGFSAQQTQQLAAAFKTANTDVEKFTAVIQNIRGIGLELEDQAKAIQLVTRLTELYGGSFEKTGNAITSTLEAGKVTQATLNQLTSQGINIQQALADNYNVSRDALLKMAKDGDISVQTLIDTLVELGNTTTQAINKPVQATDVLNQRFEALTARITASAGSINTALLPAYTTLIRLTAEALRVLDDYIAGLQALATSAAQYITPIVNKFIEVKDAIIGAQVQLPGFVSAIAAWAKEIVFALNPALRVLDFIRNKGAQQKASATATGLYGRYAAPESQVTPLSTFKAPGQMPSKGTTGAKGPKPPEDRTKILLSDLKATIAIGDAEDRIRDLLFQGRDIAAARAELDKTVYDIERDRIKQLEQANYLSEKDAINKTAAARTANAVAATEDKIREIQQQRFEEELQAQEAVRNAIKPFTELRKQQEAQAQYAKTYLRLVTEGMLPAEAERIANFEQLAIQQTTAVAEQIRLTEGAILEAKARGASTVELDKQLKAYKDQQKAIADQVTAGPGAGLTPEQRAAEAVAQLRGELNALGDPVNAAVAGANAIGSAFQQAFQGLATGTMTAQEALTSFFKTVGESFVAMAAEIIAKQLTLITLQLVLKALGVVSSAGGGGSGGGDLTAGIRQYPLEMGGGAPGSVPFAPPAFAEGGFVTKPTYAMVGEGSDSEYIIPASKMRTAMSRYAAGARGSAVIPAGGDNGELMGNGESAAPGTIDVRYTVERINNVDYVTAEQFQMGMREAAARGAAQGEQRTLRRLQTSVSTRKRVGV